MAILARWFTLVLLLLLAGPLLAQQPYQYHVYIDADLRDTSGCTVTVAGQTFAGADYRLTAEVTGSPPVVSARRLAACSGGGFGAGADLGAGYPVGRNNGLPLAAGGQADVIELMVARSLLPGSSPLVRVAFSAENAAGSADAVFTSTGQPGGPGMVVGTPQLIPTLGFWGGVLLALALGALGVRTLKRNRALAQLMLLGMFLSLGLAAWAANFIADGQVSDWAGTSPLGTDPPGDPVPNLASADIVGVFGTEERPNLAFRIDVVDAENRPPVAVNDSYTTLEDTVLTVPAPGVLGNDSDPDGNPITAQLVSGPTRGTLTLNADGSFTYTPNANLNGPDSFTYNAFDGQVASLTPATVTINVTAVNDAPSFTAGPNQTVLEDAGAQTVNPWATAINDGDPEVTQGLNFEVTNNTNAALFSAGPAISPTGVLTYTPAANANGSATITLRLRDDGGTANGGVDVSPTQTFTITVTAVNDAPSFTAGPNQTVLEDAGAQTVNPWATAINDGDPEVTQGLSFEVTNNTNAALFSAGPAISPTGVLSYTPAPNANGSATITLRLRDDGGTANGGIDVSPTQTFTITVTSVNDAPSFTAGPNQTVLEDAGAQTVNPWATAIDDGDPEATQALTFEITNNTNAALFSAGPAISPTGVLSYTPAADANGVATITLRLRDDGGTANGGIDVSPTQTFTITVTAVNDAPSFTAANPPAVLEDSGAASVPNWATFNPGPADESGQTVLGYQVSAISNAALFATPPAIATNGTLSYTPAPNAAGSSTFTVRVQDSGGTANGGVDLSPAQTFTVTVTGVNDAPSFTAGPNQSVNEDAGAQTVNPWATAINDGDPEVTQGLSFEITANSNPALFSAGPAVSPTGALSYTPAANANGVATITLRIVDDGGTANGGINASATQSFTITINAVNDAPTFVAGPNQVVAEDAGPQTVSPWATAIDDGDPELTQTLSFQVTGNSNPGLFSAAPAVAADGTLTYTPAANANGVATITLVLVDNGSNVAPNQNTSTPRTFTITVTAVNDAPVNTVPGIQNAGAGLLVFSLANGNAISVFDVDAGTASIEVGLTVTGGTLGAVVTPGVTIAGQGTATLTLTGAQTAINTALDGLSYTPAGAGTDTLTVTTSDLGNTGAGGVQLDIDTVPILIDEPPTVTLIPANGAVVAAGSNVTFSFSESVAVAAGALTINCTPSGASYVSPAFATSMGVNVTGGAASTGQPGDSCTVTAFSNGVTDVDLIDPPNELDGDASGDSIDGDVDNFVSSYTVDAAPRVTTVVPANGATQVGTAATITVSFSEPVEISSAAAFSLECGGMPMGYTVTAPALLPASASSATLTPFGGLPEGANCSFTAFAAQLPDSDSIDPPDTMAADFTSTFTVDVAPTVSSVTPAAGATVGTGATLSVSFSEPVNLATGAFTLDCGGPVTLNASPALPASGTSSVTLTPASSLPAGASCTFTVVASAVTDSDPGDPPDAMAANFVRTFNTDAAPTVTGTVPATGASNVGLADNIVITFSEAVNFLPGAFTLECPVGNAIAFTVSGTGTNTATIDPTPATLPINTACRVTVDMAQVTDVDTADPPNAGSGITTINFTTVNDNAPTVTTNPAAGGSNVAINSNITVTFNEAVTLSGSWFQLDCPTSGVRSSTGELTGTGITIIENTPDLVYTIDPSANLASGEQCTITIDSANVVDNDAIDPPNELDGNASGDTIDGDADDYVALFTTPDVAPTVTITPAAGATVADTQTIGLTFSEAVNLAAGAIALDCGSVVAFTPSLPQGNVTTLTLTPTTALPAGANCTLTLESTRITDVDALDPPNELDGNNSGDTVDGDPDDVTRSFSVDQAPSVTGTTPANGATNVIPTGNITVNFSESVNFSTLAGAPNTSFDLLCNATATDFSVATASPASSVVINPVDAQVAARNCTLSIRAAGISDVDATDPPDNLAADVNVAIEYGGLAENDSYAVTPHLTLVVDAGVQGGRVTANDVIGGGTITGFGPTLGTANSTVANGVNTITAGGAGGRVILAANGSFTYLPDAGDNAASGAATFFYTVTGGDTAQVTLSFENEEFLWFVDGSAAGPVCTGSNVGTQACPATTLSSVGAVDTANDLIFIDTGSYACGLVLEAGTTVIGNGSSGTLTALAAGRVSPIAGSSFAPYDALNGGDPQLTSTTADCITLASGNTIRGLTIGDTGNFAGLVGTNYGTLTVVETTINGSGQILNLDTGTVNATFDALASTSSDNSFAALRVANSTANLASVAGTSISGAAANTAAIELALNAGTGFAFGNTTVTKTTAGAAVRLGNGSVQPAPVSFGALNITSGNGAALELNRQTGTVTATAGTIAATNGPAITSTNAGGLTPLAMVLASASSTNSPGAGIDIGQTSGSLVIGGGSISGSTGTAFAAQGAIGTISYGGSIAKTSAGTLVAVTGAGTGNLTLSGNLSCTSNCGSGAGNAGLRVSSRTGGTIAFTGGSKVFSSSAANPSVSLDANTGATVTFSGGGLVITNTSGTGFSATNGGSVNVTGNGNSIASITGAALVIDHASPQATALEFASITAAGGTSSHGILLDNINGSVTVTGATAIGPKTTAGIELSNSSVSMQLSTASTVTISNRPSTGIRIANTSGLIHVGNTTINSTGVGTPAIRIDASSSAITFAQTNIDMGGAGGNENFLVGAGPAADTFTPGDNSGDGDAIYVTTLTGSLTINGGTITRPGDDGIDIRNSRNLSLSGMSFVEAGRSASAGCVDCNSSGVQAYALTGTNSVANSSFVRGRLRNFYISNPSGTTTLNITGSTFDDTRGQGTPATDNLQIYTSGTASAAFNISNSTFLRSATHQINAVSKDNSAIAELDITGITMRNDGGASSGVFVDAVGASSIAFNLIGNPQLHTQDENVVTVAAGGTAQVQGRIQDNPDMRFSTASAGGSVFGGIRVLSDGSTSRVTLDVSGNTLLVDNGTSGFNPSVQGDASARIDTRFANNRVTAAGAAGIPLDAINGFVNPTVGPGTAKVLCMTLTGNTVDGIWARAARVRALSPTAIYVTGYSGSFAATWAAQGNVSGGLLVAEFASGGGSVGAPPASCETPSHALP